MMPVSSILYAYLSLECAMLNLDRLKSPLAKDVRALLDSVWSQLTDAEHDWLSERCFGQETVLAQVVIHPWSKVT